MLFVVFFGLVLDALLRRGGHLLECFALVANLREFVFLGFALDNFKQSLDRCKVTLLLDLFVLDR